MWGREEEALHKTEVIVIEWLEGLEKRLSESSWRLVLASGFETGVKNHFPFPDAVFNIFLRRGATESCSRDEMTFFHYS